MAGRGGRCAGARHDARTPIDRFAFEASALVATLDKPGYFQVLRRERMVAEDWLLAIDANRYSVRWRFIGKTVQVVRVGTTGRSRLAA